MNKNTLSRYSQFSIENEYATAELDNTVPIMVVAEIYNEFFEYVNKGIFLYTLI